MRRTVIVAASMLLVAGCGSTGGSPASVAGGTAPSAGGSAAAAKPNANAIGPKGTACELPVSFEVAKDWKPKQIKVEAGDPLAALSTQGPFSAVCEIDAKPAGLVGFLRVYTGKSGSTPKEALEAFIGADKNARKPAYADFSAAGTPATEVKYEAYSKLLEESRKQSAFAVQTPPGAVVVHLGGIDTEGHEEMLPAYEMAKSSVAVSG